jgi:hypothetical protein
MRKSVDGLSSGQAVFVTVVAASRHFLQAGVVYRVDGSAPTLTRILDELATTRK